MEATTKTATIPLHLLTQTQVSITPRGNMEIVLQDDKVMAIKATLPLQVKTPQEIQDILFEKTHPPDQRILEDVNFMDQTRPILVRSVVSSNLGELHPLLQANPRQAISSPQNQKRL